AVALRTIDPSIPDALAAVVHRALTRDPARRFQNAKEMLDALTATGIGGTQSHPMLTPRTVPGAPPPEAMALPDSGGATNPEGGGRTRVSWTTGDPRNAAVAATVSESDQRRQTRARVVRRRGLIVLGAA